jgi:hypothetical protein
MNGETKLLPFALGKLFALSVGRLMGFIKNPGPEQRRAIKALALTTTSRQLYDETKLLPFVHGKVFALSVGCLLEGIKKFSPEQRRAIGNIEFPINDEGLHLLGYEDEDEDEDVAIAGSLQEPVRPILDELPGVKNIEIADCTAPGEISELRNEPTAKTSKVNIVVESC